MKFKKLLFVIFLLYVLPQIARLYSMGPAVPDEHEAAAQDCVNEGTQTDDGKTEFSMVQAEEFKLPGREIYGNHKRLRFQMLGDPEEYYHLFRIAVVAENYELQVALANAYFASVQDNDAAKDFTIFDEKMFKIFPCSRQRGAVGPYRLPINTYYLYKDLYFKAFDMPIKMEDSIEVYQAALKSNFAPAVLFDIINPLTVYSVDPTEDKKRLKVLAETGDHESMLEYGKALMLTRNPEEQVVGLKYMHDSGFLTLEYPREGEEFDSFLDRHRYPDGCSFFVYKDLWLIMEKNIVLAGSRGDFADAVLVQDKTGGGHTRVFSRTPEGRRLAEIDL